MSGTKKLPEDKTSPTADAQKLPKSRGLTQAKVKELIDAAILKHHHDDPEPISEAKVVELATRVVKDIVAEHSPKTPRTFLFNVRWEHPHIGGFPMPKGMCFYGFRTFRMTETELGAGIDLEAVRARALELGAEDRGLNIEGISILPEGF